MRHALITAGSKGLGKKVAESLLAEGYSLTINYRSDDDAIERLRDEWHEHFDRIQFVKGDVTKKQDLVNLVQVAYERFSRIDVLILNAGPYIFERKKLLEYSDDEWEQMINGNLSSAFYLFKQVIPIMRDQNYGYHIWISRSPACSWLDVSLSICSCQSWASIIDKNSFD